MATDEPGETDFTVPAKLFWLYTHCTVPAAWCDPANASKLLCTHACGEAFRRATDHVWSGSEEQPTVTGQAPKSNQPCLVRLRRATNRDWSGSKEHALLLLPPPPLPSATAPCHPRCSASFHFGRQRARAQMPPMHKRRPAARLNPRGLSGGVRGSRAGAHHAADPNNSRPPLSRSAGSCANPPAAGAAHGALGKMPCGEANPATGTARRNRPPRNCSGEPFRRSRERNRSSCMGVAVSPLCCTAHCAAGAGQGIRARTTAAHRQTLDSTKPAPGQQRQQRSSAATAAAQQQQRSSSAAAARQQGGSSCGSARDNCSLAQALQARQKKQLRVCARCGQQPTMTDKAPQSNQPCLARL